VLIDMRLPARTIRETETYVRIYATWLAPLVIVYPTAVPGRRQVAQAHVAERNAGGSTRNVSGNLRLVGLLDNLGWPFYSTRVASQSIRQTPVDWIGLCQAKADCEALPVADFH